MAQLFSNNGSSFLSVSIDTTETSLTLTPGTGVLFPVVDGISPDNFCMVTVEDAAANYEIMKVVQRNADILVVERAQEGSTALAFPSGSRIEVRLTQSTIERFPQRNDDGELFEALNFGGNKALQVADGTDDQDGVNKRQLDAVGGVTEALKGEVRRNTTAFAVAGGVPDALIASFTSPFQVLDDGIRCVVRIASDNETTTPTINVDALGVRPIVRSGNKPLVIGDLQSDMLADLMFYNGAWELLNPIKPRVEDSVDLLYPVNSIYITHDASVNPTDLFGIGTWERIAQGRFLLGAGDGVDPNGVERTYVVGNDSWGTYKHALSLSEMPAHSHKTVVESKTSDGKGGSTTQNVGDDGNASGRVTLTSSKVGNNAPHENTPPAFGVHVWRRTS